jgi:hypothetical protein
MTEIICIKLVEPMHYGVHKIAWLDGYEAIVDLRPVLAEGEAFALPRASPDRFASVTLAEVGRAIGWLDDQGDEIDLGAESLRRRAERQGEMLCQAS